MFSQNIHTHVCRFRDPAFSKSFRLSIVLQTHLSLLNKSSGLAPALGVANFTNLLYFYS